MKTQRNFKYKQIDMLIAARTITKNFEDHKAEIVALKSKWQDPYIDDLKTRINYAISHYIAQNPRATLKEATLSLKELQTEALLDLSNFKLQLQLEMADKARVEILLSKLGFASNYNAARNGDQEALIQLLFTFKDNMTNALKNELAGIGIETSLTDTIKSYAIPLREADVEQENLKDVTKALTDEAIEEYNAIYKEIMAICRITARLFADNTNIKNKFTFSKVAKRLNGNPRKKDGIQQLIIGENQVDIPNLRDDINPDAPPAEDVA